MPAQQPTNSENLTLRYGIIGVGCIGMEHLRNILLLENSYVAAIADTFEPSIAQANNALEVQSECHDVYDDYEDLINADNVDVIIIATPNNHHIEVLRKTVDKDKHILVEKPLCTTVEDCLEVKELYKDFNKMFWVGMEYRYMPSIGKMIQEIGKGEIGNLKQLSIREHRFPFLQKVNNWNRLNVNTGGTLVEKCCHFFDLMAHITKSVPVQVYATGGQAVNHIDEVVDGQPSDILDNAFVVLTFESGIRCMLDLCMFAEASKNQEEVVAVGTEGKMEAFAPAHGNQCDDKNEINFRLGKRSLLRNTNLPPNPEDLQPLCEEHVGVDEKLLKAGYHEGSTYFELVHMEERIRSSSFEPEVSLDDGIMAVMMGMAAHESIETGVVVNFREFAPFLFESS